MLDLTEAKRLVIKLTSAASEPRQELSQNLAKTSRLAYIHTAQCRCYADGQQGRHFCQQVSVLQDACAGKAVHTRDYACSEMVPITVERTPMRRQDVGQTVGLITAREWLDPSVRISVNPADADRLLGIWYRRDCFPFLARKTGTNGPRKVTVHVCKVTVMTLNNRELFVKYAF